MDDECPRALPAAAAGLAAGTWDVTVFRTGSVPSALARSSRVTQVTLRHRFAPGRDHEPQQPHLRQPGQRWGARGWGTATGSCVHGSARWRAGCRRHPPPGPRPAPGCVPAPPAPGTTPPAPPAAAPAVPAVRRPSGPRSSPGHPAAVGGVQQTGRPDAVPGAVVTDTHILSISKPVSQLTRVSGGFQTRFGTQKLPREATPAAVS